MAEIYQGDKPNLEKAKEIKEQHKFSDLTIFTTTLYGKDEVSAVREKLAIKFLTNADNLGINCVIVDGGSNENFLEEIKNFKNVKLIVNKDLKMGESRRAALSAAIENFDTPYYLWAEPEKDDLIREDALLAMIEDLRKNQADIVVPKRKDKSSMPPFQAWIESRANKRMSRIMREGLEDEVYDFWFGPKIFNRQGAKYFKNYESELDKWDAIIVPVVNAYHDGLKISTASVDYTYDPLQSSSENNDRKMMKKRLEQYANILAEVDPYWKEKLRKNENGE